MPRLDDSTNGIAAYEDWLVTFAAIAGDWKVVFLENRGEPFGVWRVPFVELRVPLLFKPGR